MTHDELDQMMAEKCMGWTPHVYDSANYVDIDQEEVVGYTFRYRVSDWHPTRDIGQAMMCAEKMTQSVTEITLMWASYDRIEHKWSCQIRIDEDREWGHAATPALAICKAIAKALEAR